MSTVDIDSHAREAAGAARASVAPIAALATTPRARRAGGPRVVRPGGPRLVLAGGAAAMAVAVALSIGGDAVPRLSTTPAGQQESRTRDTPPPLPTPALSGAGVPLAAGTATDGRGWRLFLGGPSDDLCLGVDGTGACAGVPFGAPADRPVHFDELDRPAFAFGRTEAGVTRVSVVLDDGTTLGPEPVVEATGGPYYVVELPDDAPPVAVVGHRADGSSVRYDR